MPERATNVRWRVLSILIFASFVSYVLRSNVSIAAPAMVADLDVTEVQWGWVLAAFTAGYAIFQIPGGIMGDRMGPRRSLTLIAVLWAVFTVATGLLPGTAIFATGTILAALVLLRFLVGAVHAPVFPVVNASIERWFPPGGRAFPTGLSSTGLTLGFAATAPVLAWMVGEWGWRTSFLVIAPFGLAAGGLWWWYSRDLPARHPGINAAELALIEGRADESGIRGGADGAPAANWWQILANRDILLLTLSYSCMNFVFYDVFNWFFYYLVTVRGFAETAAGLVTSTQWIAGAVGAAAGGWLCDRLSRQLGLRWGSRLPVVAGLLLSGGMLVTGALTANVTLAMVALALCFLFNQMTEGAYWATSMTIGGRNSGTAGGVMNTGANLMGIVNSLLVPVLAAWLGWTFALASGGIFALVGAVLMLLVRADRPFDAANGPSPGAIPLSQRMTASSSPEA